MTFKVVKDEVFPSRIAISSRSLPLLQMPGTVLSKVPCNTFLLLLSRVSRTGGHSPLTGSRPTVHTTLTWCFGGPKARLVLVLAVCVWLCISVEGANPAEERLIGWAGETYKPASDVFQVSIAQSGAHTCIGWLTCLLMLGSCCCCRELAGCRNGAWPL